MKTTERMDYLPVEPAIRTFMRAGELEKSGADIIHLEIGEPDFDTPSHISLAAKEALDRGKTHYCDPQGVLELREAIAATVGARSGVSVDPGCVVVTPGLRPVLFYGALATLQKGDEGIFIDPAFAAFPTVIEFAEARAVPVALREELGYRLDMNELRAAISPRTRLLMLNSPHNPSGGILSADDMAEIEGLAREHDFVVLSDETYEEIYYGDKPSSVAEFPGMRDRAILLSGFSKTYCMTGWRLGYAVVPPSLVDAFVKLATNSVTCSSTFVQHAAVSALQGSQDSVRSMVAEFRMRRDVLVDGLNRIPGISCHVPEGAFYAFPNITGVGMSDVQLADVLLEKAGVATLAGSVFGQQGKGHLRLAFTTPLDRIQMAIERIGNVVSTLPAPVAGKEPR
ncbi:MAG: pyridoxal phosphate-dependent aminotransferase [Dehalococcoidia bacterium]|nr:pyridoxal phosphate-dependent aminotransferase [Dehalococcoidia bacterium]